MARPVQQFVARFAHGRFRHAHADAISIATYELLDNALNFGSISHDVVLELLSTATAVDVEVSNHAAPARIAMLTQELDRVRGGSAAYASVQPGAPQTDVGRLGLARVAHDARMALRLAAADDHITVTARLVL